MTNSTLGKGRIEKLAFRVTQWSEKWFPDSYIFACFAVLSISLGALCLGVSFQSVAQAFGDGYWSLIPFTLQMVMVSVSGYVVASSPPASKMIQALARLPKTGRGAVAYVAFMSILASLLNWALSLVFSGLFIRALARRKNFRMDYRAAAAAGYLGLGATWALGLGSSAAQFQANPDAIPKSLLKITGVIPFSETIFLWQSLLMVLVIGICSVLIAYFSAPEGDRAKTAEDLGIDLGVASEKKIKLERPGEWLEHSPFFTLLIGGLGLVWLIHELSVKGIISAISNLNVYNFLFLTLGMFLHWRPKSFLDAVSRAVPSASGVLIQFPLYGSIAYILTQASNSGGETLSHRLSTFFVNICTPDSFPLVMGAYSAVLGFFVPSGGGKWIIEAPYIMQASNDLKAHLGWTVQIYNAAEALPNLINPFWMLPLLGVLGLKAKDVMGYTFTQFIIHVPIVLFLLWALAGTLVYHAPI